MQEKEASDIKLVNSIVSSLDESNYNPVDLPEKEEILTAYLERPRRKNDPGKVIKWTNVQPCATGRQRRADHDVIRGSVGVKGAGRRTNNPREDQRVLGVVLHKGNDYDNCELDERKNKESQRESSPTCA